MFKSIRKRLIASYVFLTLLTVAAFGVLGVGLVQSYAARQEREFLTANAQAVAHQAIHFMRLSDSETALLRLAQSAAFLGDIHVQIFDAADRLLVASSAEPVSTEMTLIVADTALGSTFATSPVFVLGVDMEPSFDERPTVARLARLRQYHARLAEEGVSPDQIASGMGVREMGAPDGMMMIHRFPTFWGNRLTFESQPDVVSASRSHMGALNLGEPHMGGPRGTVAPATITATRTQSPVVTQTASSLVTDAIGAAEMPPWGAHRAMMAQSALAPITDDGAEYGYVVVSRASDLAAEPLAALRRVFMWAALGATLLATVIGLGVSRGLTAPVQSLAQAASQMESGDLSARAPVHSRDELGALARQFNRMAEQLQQSFDALQHERDTLRRFVADASHELRTPMTALRTFSELLEGSAGDDAEARAEFLHESQAQLARLEWITRNLLDLSRLDGGVAALDLGEHDAATLVESALASFQARAQAAGLMLETHVPSSPVTLVCDGARIEIALRNLIDNALKFSHSGGRIAVGVDAPPEAGDGGEARFWVQDTGAGIDPADLPHIFERFYRSPRARQEGSGLGLAIVQSIVQAHGGEVEVESAPDTGSRFTLRLPLRRPAPDAPPA